MIPGPEQIRHTRAPAVDKLIARRVWLRVFVPMLLTKIFRCVLMDLEIHEARGFIMQTQARDDFKEFISTLCRGICSKLRPQYDPGTLTTVCSSFAGDVHEDIIDCVLSDWHKCRCQETFRSNPDDLISILLLNMIGPLNRVRLPDCEGRADFNYTFLTLMDRLLQNDQVQPRFLHFSQQLMTDHAA